MFLGIIALLWSALPCILAQEVSPRIVGGSTAGSNYPYFIRWGGCGATLIHHDIALGAAHVSKLIVMVIHYCHDDRVSPVLDWQWYVFECYCVLVDFAKLFC